MKREIDKKLIESLKSMRTLSPTLGGDPEFFIADPNGKILPSDKFFPGKDNPLILNPEIDDKKRHNKIFFDGIQGEINPAAASCRDVLLGNLQKLLEGVSARIAKNSIVLKPSVRVLKSVLEEADPEARRFGCMPDFNAYTCTTNTCEMDASRHFLRYAGGHIHMGASTPYLRSKDPEYKLVHDEMMHLRLVKFLDVLVGVMSVIFDNGQDAKRRRTKYGLAGCFRPTPYGIEYRTPSCWWLKSPLFASLVYGMARLSWTIVVRNLDNAFRKATGAEEEEVRRICNESDTRAAKKLWANMRPYIMLAGAPRWNPLHCGSGGHVLSGGGMYYSHSDDFVKIIRETSRPPEKLTKSKNDILSLPAFDYIIKNGAEIVISDDVKKDWALGSVNGFNKINGFLVAATTLIRKNTEVLKDFMKYQSKYYEQVV